MKKITVLFILLLVCSALPAHAAVEKEKRLWQDESVYSIMIDRFNNGDTKNDIDVNAKDPLTYNGGDFQGVIDKLDYIKEMGFTAIRLSPIFANAKDGYHGDWVEDFYQTDEHFGTIETFKQLVKEAHKRNIKVLIDFVANNTALTHPWVNDPSKQDWYHPKQVIQDKTNQEQLEKGWVEGLPDLNQENPEVKKYLIDAAAWWINKTGIDGYSLPEVNNVPLSFWSDFSKAVKQEKKDFILIGVPSEQTVIETKQYQQAGIDSVLDYSYSEKLRKAFATTKQPFSSIGQVDPLQATFFDNENTVRFTNDIVDKRQFPGARWKTAMTYLYTTPGMPIIYYGTEIALIGGEIPDNRRQMNFRTEKELIDYITKLAELRNQLPSLTRGTMEVLYDKGGMMVYKRVYKGETSVVAINNSTTSQKVILTDKQIKDHKELRGLLGGDLVRSRDHQYILIVDRDVSEIYVLAEKTGLNYVFIFSLVLVAILAVVFLILIRKRSKK